jgi:hypothetical protein
VQILLAKKVQLLDERTAASPLVVRLIIAKEKKIMCTIFVLMHYYHPNVVFSWYAEKHELLLHFVG